MASRAHGRPMRLTSTGDRCPDPLIRDMFQGWDFRLRHDRSMKSRIADRHGIGAERCWQIKDHDEH